MIPSLPGYGFSERPRRTTMRDTARLWHRLMQGLGYKRYGAQGGDFGASVTTYMALDEPAPLLGIHLHTIDDTPYSGGRPLSATERDYREAFRIAHDISSYSFPAMAKAAAGRLEPGSALLTLTYLGALRSVPNYNTMGLAKASLEASVRYLAASLGSKGVRVNGISAGPIKTLAASGIKGFGKILDVVAQNAPLRRNVTIDDVGNAAAFLLSDLAAGITSEIVYVDGGFSHAMPGAA